MPTVTGYVYGPDGLLVPDAKVRLYRRDTGVLLASGLSGDGSEEIPGDPDFDHVQFLSHLDGTNGGTEFTDLSGTPKTITLYNSPTLSTSQKKFGETSFYKSGLKSFIASGTTALGSTDDFTFECWIYAMSYPNDSWLVGPATSTSHPSLMIHNSKLCYGFYNDGPDTVSYNTWHHIAASRSVGVTKWFLDGVQQGSISDTRSSAAQFGVGDAQDRFAGYIDEVRYDVGLARYTEAFTPPTEAFIAGDIPGKPLGLYSVATNYTGEVQRVVCALDTWDPIENDLVDRILLS